MTILIVDDNDENLYMLQVLLKGHGFDVEMAVNGIDALNKAQKQIPELVISDILMPKMDGFALCRRWKKDNKLKDIPFIIYTATYTDQKDKQLALNLGADRYLLKPTEPDALMQIINEVLKEHQILTSENIKPSEPNEEEYLRQHNEVLVRKLEEKINALQVSNRALEQEISERKAIESTLLASVRNHKAKIQELYHRANSDMYFINSLLVMDADEYKSEPLQKLVSKTENRIHAITLLHQMICHSKDFSQIYSDDYIEKLSNILAQKYQGNLQKVRFSTIVTRFFAKVETAVILGIILGELIYNSLTLGLTDRKDGEITIRMHREGGQKASLRYTDNGAFFSKEAGSDSLEKIGYNVIKRITDSQINGQVTIIEGENRFSLEILFSDLIAPESGEGATLQLLPKKLK